MSKAYRQVGVPQSRKHAAFGFPSGKGSWLHYLSQSLPFGASASVFGFNKVPLAILRIGFYDDYTLFEFKRAASLLHKISMRLLSLLGWSFATECKKFRSRLCPWGYPLT